MKLGFFDLETQYLFQDIHPQWKTLRWRDQERLRIPLIPKLKLAIAGICFTESPDVSPVYHYYTVHDIEQLESDLLALDRIIGHNLMRFDYLVLTPHFSPDTLTTLRAKTIDTWELLRQATNQFIPLNDLGALNLGLTKTHDTLKIPQMWREGHHQEVQEYLQRDLDLVAQIWHHAITHNQLTYTQKDYGRIIGPKTIPITWTLDIRTS